MQSRGYNQENIQNLNRTLLLRLLRREGASTRIQLSKQSLLKQATVTNIVSDFISWGLVKETERQLGRSLVTQDVKDLLYLTDYLGLPQPVVLLLVRYCLDTQAPGARLTLRQIKNQGHKWYDAGVRTLADADSHIARMAQRRDRHRTLLALLDRPGRPPMRQEAAYLDAWLDMGFQDEVIRQAYERTVFQVGELKWGYMNGILKSWHEQGLHTLAEVQAAEQKYRRRKPQGGAKGQSQAPAAPQPQTPVDTSDLDRFLARMEQKKKEGT